MSVTVFVFASKDATLKSFSIMYSCRHILQSVDIFSISHDTIYWMQACERSCRPNVVYTFAATSAYNKHSAAHIRRAFLLWFALSRTSKRTAASGRKRMDEMFVARTFRSRTSIRWFRIAARLLLPPPPPPLPLPSSTTKRTGVWTTRAKPEHEACAACVVHVPCTHGICVRACVIHTVRRKAITPQGLFVGAQGAREKENTHI